MDIQTALITAVKCLIRVFFGYKPDWIKYFDRPTGLGSDRIIERKFWTGLGFQKSPICSTLRPTMFQRCTESEISDSDSAPASAEYTPTPLRLRNILKF